MKKMAFSHMLERGGGGGGLQFIVSENGAQRFQLPSPSQLSGVFQPNTENPVKMLHLLLTLLIVAYANQEAQFQEG
jgi:hypothetical protein